ncbi:MAG TPA: helix-turn-helix transcriptional regulator [Oscillospiraceae bacterium]|nr:helix-turn-helix transcriptional regulator [Oscillospiraceae bacterium]
MTLGQKIREARLARGLTQKEVVGDYITRNMLSKIENDSATPSVGTLEYLTAKLGLPAGSFLSEAGLSNGSVPDGLDDARRAFREKRWGDCLGCLEADKTAGSTDEGYLLHARAGAAAAAAARRAGDWAAARDLAETALYYNREGMYYDEVLEASLTLTLAESLMAEAPDAETLRRARALLETSCRALEKRTAPGNRP